MNGCSLLRVGLFPFYVTSSTSWELGRVGKNFTMGGKKEESTKRGRGKEARISERGTKRGRDQKEREETLPEELTTDSREEGKGIWPESKV